ncbi:TetR/AcrR family transcriptional regulator [Peptostreptococcaceae bacterium AGR-M142]
MNKELKKNRVKKYFIEAAVKIIETEGIDKITIRKVADLSGYNSATIYNYFENLDHLVFLAALKFIKPYTSGVGKYVKGNYSALERNYRIWEYYCLHSFKYPHIYHAIFFAKLNKPLDNYIISYYELYPEEIVVDDRNISSMLSKQSIYERAHVILEQCVDEGFLKEDDLDDLNEMILYIYKGTLNRVLNKEIDKPLDEIVAQTMKYIKVCYRGFLQKKEESK